MSYSSDQYIEQIINQITDEEWAEYEQREADAAAAIVRHGPEAITQDAYGRQLFKPRPDNTEPPFTPPHCDDPAYGPYVADFNDAWAKREQVHWWSRNTAGK